MQFHYINKLIQLPEINVKNILFDDKTGVVYLSVEPIQHVQPCPYCGSHDVYRDGVLYHPQVRHLPLANWRTILWVPAVNMECQQCRAHFVWQYAFIPPKKRYTKAFQHQLIKQGQGVTVQSMSVIQCVPYSTAETGRLTSVSKNIFLYTSIKPCRCGDGFKLYVSQVCQRNLPASDSDCQSIPCQSLCD